jgi:hypothetical protein
MTVTVDKPSVDVTAASENAAVIGLVHPNFDLYERSEELTTPLFEKLIAVA